MVVLMMIYVLQTGLIYLEVDLQSPCSVGANSIDGYSGLTTTLLVQQLLDNLRTHIKRTKS
jgi:hypothetical protein